MRYASRGLSLAVVLLFSVSILSVFVAAQDGENNSNVGIISIPTHLQVHPVLVMERSYSPKDRM